MNGLYSATAHRIMVYIWFGRACTFNKKYHLGTNQYLKLIEYYISKW